MTIYRSAAAHGTVLDWCVERLAAWPVPHESVRLPSRLGDTHVLTAGDGPPLVFLPGTNFNAAVSTHLLARLAEHHRVVAIDLPGQPGLSAPERPKGGAAFYGHWLRETIDALDVRGATIVGHALGGGIALAGTAAGACVGSLVLLDPAGLVPLRVGRGILARNVPWLVRPNPKTARWLLASMTARNAEVDPDLLEWMVLVGHHVRGSFAPPALSERVLARVRVPVTVVAGAEDPFLPPADLDRGVRRLPDATLRIVPGVGHLLPYEQPAAVLDALDSAVAAA